MNERTWQLRKASGNPIYPYTWLARYVDGSSLSQFDVIQRRTSRDIDLGKVEDLVVLNHPASPIIVPAHLGRPDEVIIKATVDMKHFVGTNRWEYKIAYFLGFRYGREAYMLEIGDGGELHRRGENVAGHKVIRG